MEAPDKIYRTTTYLDNDKGKTLWKEAPVKGAENIEYTRTDAFIDKAAIWFNNNLGHDECGVISYQFDTEEEMIKDFIEYMKGE